MNNTGYKVQINLYDLSQGMAKAFSPMFLGKQIDGIWHTGIVVYEKEYYFGGGICAGLPKQTPYGYPVQIIEHGHTEIPQEIFENFLNEISSRYSMEKYDLFNNNCNNFSNECSEFLVSKPIPEHITGLPAEILNTQIGQMIKPMIDQLTSKAINDNQSQHFGASQNSNLSDGQNQSSSQNQAQNQQELFKNVAELFNKIPTQQPNDPQQSQQQKPSEETNVISIEDIEMFICLTESSPKCIIDFYADWCGPCKVIKPKFAQLSNQHKDIQFYQINIDKAQEIADQLDVKSIPTFMTYKNGQLVERWTGGNPATLSQKIDELNN